MAFCTIGVSKQKGGSVGASGRHNDRERDTPNADPERSHLNRVLIGDERNVKDIVSEIIDAHGGKPRRDSVEAVELMLSASHEWFLDRDGEISQEKVDQFCEQAMKFLRDRKNCGVCAKAVLHMDERTPHIHAHMVPLTEDGRLSATHFLDGREKMKQLHTRYASYMEEIGLERGREGSRATHQRVKQFYASVSREPELKIDPDKIPDPSRLKLLTAEGVTQYKLEVLKHVLEQVKEPLRILQDQAQLTRDEHAHRVEAGKRADAAERQAAERVTEVEREALVKIAEVEREAAERSANLEHSARAILDENTELRRENKGLLASRKEYYEKFVTEQVVGMKARSLGERLADIPLLDIMEHMGYGRGEDQGNSNVFRDAAGHVVMAVTASEQQARDQQQRLICRNSLDLVVHMRRQNEGRAEFTQEQGLTWLRDEFGESKAAGAYLVNREQAVHGLFERTRPVPEHDRDPWRGPQDRMQDRDRSSRRHGSPDRGGGGRGLSR